ncbi:Septum-promoting GTP-binding protein 1 [Ananas comosus]|uniref:Septum-promoting GTP-binding protein 1 n=2 Tax=Ananas comosus TaxID=4615 RepID=A0A199V0S0_ANACO|nr:Septum-promoting GTP-binding protein 1 [Ananas comosus]
MTTTTTTTIHRGCRFCRRGAAVDPEWARLLRRFVRRLLDHLLACSCAGPASCSGRYRRLGAAPPVAPAPAPAPILVPAAGTDIEADSDVVSLKVSLLGDCHIGKTSFMVKYVGDEEEQKGLQMRGLNLMDKVLVVRGARITFSIWDVGGESRFRDHVPIACKDAAAILIMFDLTSRCTLNNAIDWYQRARKWNKTALPILIGTKFDDFVQLPLEMQWMIINQARAYARVMKATLFFSSATHNINVNKIFKFITAKLFNLPWTIERNLTIGEPTIDF